jgi:alkanesulfonate monooxygenase
MPPYFPGGLDDFAAGVIPILQRRGLFRTEYEGQTLREHFGFPRPPNPHGAAAASRERARS